MGGTGVLIGGIVALIIGVILTAGGSAAQSYSSSDTAACGSMFGQGAQFISPDIKQRCATVSATNSFGGIAQVAGYGLVAVGVVLIAVGGIQKARVKKSASW